MYTPPPFAVEDPDAIAAMIARARLGVLVTHGPQGLTATHLPFLHDQEGGRLLAHVARPNPHPAMAGEGEALVIFPGPEAYVSPGWYPSKAETGRQVPTWNYEAVHVHGRLEWFDDRDRLRDLLDRLTATHEAGRPQPWSIADAPEYVERLLAGIVGVELTITRVEAKRKLSQNKPERDRDGVARGLAASPDPRDRALAQLMERARL
ncbi:MAG TPA: FMN-binding negative transcriptional regulator [Caulobacteraceae bacterium]|nr:FMN-binding negative transcriptional regulator [Caulobacteraceae bacterium]